MKSKLIIIVSVILLIVIVTGFRIGRYSDIQSNKAGRIIWRGNPDINQIALTFDDGPSGKYTSKILDILDQYNIKATFFVVGEQVKNNKDIIKKMIKSGHDVGNHTYYHIDGKTVKLQRIENNIKFADILIERYTGVKPRFFRPTYGYANWRFLKIAEKLKYDIIMWSVDAGEWNNYIKDDIVNRVIENTSNGAIILLHDGGPSREVIIEALPEIIEKLINKGYKFVTMTKIANNLD